MGAVLPRLLLEPDGPVLEPEDGGVALAAPRRLQGVSRAAAEAHLQEEPPLLGDLLLRHVGYGHLVGSSPAHRKPA